MFVSVYLCIVYTLPFIARDFIELALSILFLLMACDFVAFVYCCFFLLREGVNLLNRTVEKVVTFFVCGVLTGIVDF